MASIITVLCSVISFSLVNMCRQLREPYCLYHHWSLYIYPEHRG